MEGGLSCIGIDVPVHIGIPTRASMLITGAHFLFDTAGSSCEMMRIESSCWLLVKSNKSTVMPGRLQACNFLFRNAQCRHVHAIYSSPFIGA